MDLFSRTHKHRSRLSSHSLEQHTLPLSPSSEFTRVSPRPFQSKALETEDAAAGGTPVSREKEQHHHKVSSPPKEFPQSPRAPSPQSSPAPPKSFPAHKSSQSPRASVPKSSPVPQELPDPAKSQQRPETTSASCAFPLVSSSLRSG
ncbi:extensin-like [Penaeus monodon]|uniref:extensin-like n=1 Tax=Penaeus monodon TaxID=6687 RepID=UPI0018A7B768|nr:extensin-like [Penaeus monodon]